MGSLGSSRIFVVHNYVVKFSVFLVDAYSIEHTVLQYMRLIFVKVISTFLHRRQPQSATELDAMRSFGISLNGPDPLQQQLKELDIQSKLMCGIQVYPPTPTRSSKSSSRGSRSSQPGPSLKPTPQAVWVPPVSHNRSVIVNRNKSLPIISKLMYSLHF